MATSPAQVLPCGLVFQPWEDGYLLGLSELTMVYTDGAALALAKKASTLEEFFHLLQEAQNPQEARP